MDAPVRADAEDAAPLARGGAVRVPVRRVLVVGTPLVYVAALTTVIVSWGLPVARDQLFFWLLLGFAAFSVGAWRSWGGMLVGWLPLLGLLVVYDELRAAVSVVPAQAHVDVQVAIDRWLGGGAVPTEWLQRRLWDAGHLHWYDYAVWGVYMTHFFAVWLVAAVLWCTSRRRFAEYGLLTVAVTLASFLVYWTYPAQPPWLAAETMPVGPVDRIVPIVWDQVGVSAIQSVYDNGDLVNTVAAMPSLHAAYPMMLLLFFWGSGPRIRVGLGLYTLAMGYALVYSGEHFVADILGGWAMACLGYGATAAALWAVREGRDRWRCSRSRSCPRAASALAGRDADSFGDRVDARGDPESLGVLGVVAGELGEL